LKKGERIALKGRFVSSTQEVLKVVEEAEVEVAARKTRRPPWKRNMTQAIESVEEQLLQVSYSQLKFGFIVVVRR
jgi:hypothetical protein